MLNGVDVSYRQPSATLPSQAATLVAQQGRDKEGEGQRAKAKVEPFVANKGWAARLWP